MFQSGQWRGGIPGAGLAACWLAVASPLSAECRGENPLRNLPGADLADLQARAAKAAFAAGSFWHPARSGQPEAKDICLTGTSHLPALLQAEGVVVETLPLD